MITIPIWVFVLLIILAAITALELLLVIIFVISCLFERPEAIPEDNDWE